MVPEKLTFSPLSRRQIEADFSGGHITSDAGLLLLREVDNQHQLTQRLATVLDDARNPVLVRHKLQTMVRQRIFGVAAGYETPPKEIVLDFDGTDIPVHGDQPGKFFNAYYDHQKYRVY